MNLKDISRLDEKGARDYFERMRWPDGPACVHCAETVVTRLGGKAGERGLFKCRACRKKFSVTQGTIFEKSHIPMRTWLMAFAIMCSSKKGQSALQLQRSLGLGSYESAWFMAHRIRRVMRGEPLQRLMSGTIEADEMYVGGKPRYRGKYSGGRRIGPPLTLKTPVVTIAERGGELRAFCMERVTAKNLRAVLAQHVDFGSRLMTDELKLYETVGKQFGGGHEAVEHSAYEFARKPDAHVNTCESFHALMRRGLHGAFHHVSRKHLSAYVGEFQQRWNTRKATDSERLEGLVESADGKRMTYAQLVGHTE